MINACKRTVLLCVLISVVSTGCTDLDQSLPAGVENPAVIDSEFGALSLYRGAMAKFSSAYQWYIINTALFTDELYYADEMVTDYVGRVVNTLDGRGPSLSDNTYYMFHSVRNSSDQALSMLLKHGQGKYNYLLSELYSVKAFSMLALSEFYCSGMPFSTIDFNDHYTYTRGYSSTETWSIIDHIFDSAILLAGDSLNLKMLAQVGKARVKMNLGLYSDAKLILDGMTETNSYSIPISGVQNRFLENSFQRYYSVPNSEGGNGLNFRMSDPRISYSFVEINRHTGDSVFRATKYLLLGTKPSIVIASGVESWLILAEITLSSGSDEWIDILNKLRTDGTYNINSNGDTLWNKGLGEISGLNPLKKPSSHSASVDLVFSEKAFWLYLTGHRQGDMRRLIRQYERDPDSVYPTGFYGSGGALLNSIYGNRIVMSVPVDEKNRNPLYSGCISEGA